MNFPYRCRLMACYPNDTPFELVRFHRPMQQADVDFWTDGILDWWEEHFLSERHCISSRPHVGPHHPRWTHEDYK